MEDEEEDEEDDDGDDDDESDTNDDELDTDMLDDRESGDEAGDCLPCELVLIYKFYFVFFVLFAYCPIDNDKKKKEIL